MPHLLETSSSPGVFRVRLVVGPTSNEVEVVGKNMRVVVGCERSFSWFAFHATSAKALVVAPYRVWQHWNVVCAQAEIILEINLITKIHCTRTLDRRRCATSTLRHSARTLLPSLVKFPVCNCPIYLARRYVHCLSPDACYISRHVALRVGAPVKSPALTINRLCGSGFETVVQVSM